MHVRDSTNSEDRRAAVILCGGSSRRMGQPKAMLPFGPETMLQRIVRILLPTVDVLVVVAAAGQELPALPREVVLTHDRETNQGPLEGLAAGLRTLSGRAQRVLLCGCDLPLVRPALVERLFDLSAGYEIVVPRTAEGDEPMLAVYRASVLPAAERLLAAGERRLVALLEIASTRGVSAADLADADARLESLTNVNTPDAYAAALARATEAPGRSRLG